MGPIQSNKTRAIAEHFDWVHSVDREKIAARLAQARGPGQSELQVCIQVNVSGEATKSGVDPAESAQLAKQVAALSRLNLRGLMAVPEPTPHKAPPRAPLAPPRDLRGRLNPRRFAMHTPSMGLSSRLT